MTLIFCSFVKIPLCEPDSQARAGEKEDEMATDVVAS